MSKESRELNELAAIVRDTNDAIIGKTVDGKVTSWNAGAERLYGYTAEEMIGQSIDVIVPPDRLSEESAILAKIHAGELVAPYVTERRRKDGTDVEISLTVAPIRDAAGAIVGASAIARDVVALQFREAQAGAQFEALLEAAPDAIIVVNEAGVITVVNHQTIELFGYGREELVGQPVEVLIPTVNRERHPSLRNGFFKHPGVRPMGAGLQLWAERKDGSKFPVDISLSPLTTSTGTLVSAAVRDITDRLRAEVALREAKEEAERANEAKSEFLSRMSHELRTPLTAILGFTELLQMGDLPASQRDSFIERTHKAGQHLLGLVNDVLDISRVQTGTLTISIEPVGLLTVVEDVVDLLAPLASQRDITIADIVAPDVVVRADLNRLRQVLLNLVSNAVKYNRSGGFVTISATDLGATVELTIADTGPGIAADDIPLLFQPFERLGIHTGEIEGTGIGLALSRALAELMNGTIRVESTLGEGSRFIVTLPRGVQATVGSDEPPEELDEDGRRATVLYIEDNPSNTVLVESALSLRPNVRVIGAVQGQLGLDLAREHRPDLILLDLHLPDIDGEAVLAALRADERTAAIPVLVVSADTTSRRIERVLASGANGYMTKPFVIRELLQAVDSALAIRSA